MQAVHIKRDGKVYEARIRGRKKNQKTIRKGSAAKARKVYIFYEQLKFLEACCVATDTTGSLPPQTVDEVNSEDVDNDLEAGNTEGEEGRSSGQEKNKRKKRMEEDPDKLSLLSLLDELKSLPSHLKLRV